MGPWAAGAAAGAASVAGACAGAGAGSVGACAAAGPAASATQKSVAAIQMGHLEPSIATNSLIPHECHRKFRLGEPPDSPEAGWPELTGREPLRYGEVSMPIVTC